MIRFKHQQTGSYSIEEYLNRVKSFHGHIAPGLIIGGMMVNIALRDIPQNILFNSFCETYNCLPDAIQLLTPCTVGNGWLRVLNFGRFALSLYEKYEGYGIRVYLDAKKLEQWDEIKTWFLKLKTKKEQNSDLLLEQIIAAGNDIYSIQQIQIHPQNLKKQSLGEITFCPVCKEAYPKNHGRICRACQGNSPYRINDAFEPIENSIELKLEKISLDESIGKTILHDITQIVPGEFKGPAFIHGQTITVGDICRLQQMGKQYVYTKDQKISTEWVHENDVAIAFAHAMAGEGVSFTEPPREGKIDFIAEIDGLLTVDYHRLEMFNLVPQVICATRKGNSIVSKGRKIGGTRAIPLFLPEKEFKKALEILKEGPLIKVLPLRKAKVGVLVTGTEIFTGLVQDKFIPIISAKIAQFDCQLVKSIIVPDQRQAICDGIKELINASADLIITTAGLSVDPDDVTRLGLIDAGAHDFLYGAPILPGAMTLLSHIGSIQVIGVPACGLYFKTTSFDVLLPRLLAGIPITRSDLSRLGHGALCWECKTCSYPKCSFGKE